jgi:copper chaperone
MEKTTINISGMSCGHCKNAVENILKEATGVKNVIVDLASAKAEVNFEGSQTSTETLKQLINDSGMYQAS